MENFPTILNKLLRGVRRMMLAKNLRCSKGEYRFYYLHSGTAPRFEIVTENGVTRYVRVKDWYKPLKRPAWVDAKYEPERCSHAACPWHQDL
jgi:hypothetical protein